MHYLQIDNNTRVEGVTALAVSGDSSYIASAHTCFCNAHVDVIFLRRADTGQDICMIEQFEGSFNCLDLNSDATFLATGGNYECENVMLWKIKNGKTSNSAHIDLKQGCVVKAVKFSRDDQRLASAGSDSIVMIWSVQSGECLLEFAGHVPKQADDDDEHGGDDWFERGVRGLAWSSDSRLIASGGYDQTVQVWDADTGKLVMEPLKGHTDIITCLDFTQDTSLLVSASYDKTIIVWQLWQGQGARVMHRLEDAWASTMSISPDSRFLVCCKLETVRVWDIGARGQEIMALRAVDRQDHSWWCHAVTKWSPEGLCILDGKGSSICVVKIAVHVRNVDLWMSLCTYIDCMCAYFDCMCAYINELYVCIH
jgi:WD40 repeat protein